MHRVDIQGPAWRQPQRLQQRGWVGGAQQQVPAKAVALAVKERRRRPNNAPFAKALSWAWRRIEPGRQPLDVGDQLLGCAPPALVAAAGMDKAHQTAEGRVSSLATERDLLSIER